MEISDLVAIGKLGRLEPDGFHCVQFSQFYKPLFDRLQECFLIFNSNRVFFVTVIDRKTVKSRTYFRFLEDGVAGECEKSGHMVVALAPEDLPDAEAENSARDLLGFTAIHESSEIGEITDAVINPLQSVLVITLNDARELMVPFVDYYVLAVEEKLKCVRLQHLEQLMDLCTSTF